MDSDKTSRAQGTNRSLDSTFPLPYRICFEVIIGVWGWGINAQVLKKTHVDLSYMLRYQTGRTLHESIYFFALGLTLLYLFSLLAYWVQLRGHETVVDISLPLQMLDVLPWITLIIVLGIFFYPGPSFHHNGRRRFLAILRRVSLGGLDSENRLNDVLLADVLTSYSKVFVDAFIVLCSLLSGRSCLSLPDRLCGGQIVVPLISLIPYTIRFRQCLIDYTRTKEILHIFNALKYASSAPVILLASLQNKFSESEFEIVDRSFVWNIWMFALFINSAYSFIWDIVFDWDLLVLKTSNSDLRVEGLRPILYLGSRDWYYMAVMADFLLRFTWIIKLSTYWNQATNYESGIFILELLEISRRWLWMFFRLESEWVKDIKNNLPKSKSLPLTEMTRND